MIKLTALDIAKFWMEVEIDKSSPVQRTSRKWLGHCWIWKGSFFESGYGRYFFHQKSYRSHRVAFLIYNGIFPMDKLVCHKCDNPTCVNPLHLFLGTSQENVQDMLNKNRVNRLRSKHKDSISKYPGISFRKEKKSNPWRARIMRNYKTIWCMEFATEEEAHSARQFQIELLSS